MRELVWLSCPGVVEMTISKWVPFQEWLICKNPKLVGCVRVVSEWNGPEQTPNQVDAITYWWMEFVAYIVACMCTYWLTISANKISGCGHDSWNSFSLFLVLPNVDCRTEVYCLWSAAIACTSNCEHRSPQERWQKKRKNVGSARRHSRFGKQNPSWR